MYGLTKKQKLDIILEVVDKNQLSAYEISKNIELTEAGVARIIKRIALKPHEKSLDKILEYLIEKKLAKELISNKIEEPSEIYNITTDPLKEIYDCQKEVNKLTMEIIKLQNTLRNNNINFKNIFIEDNEE